MPQSSQLSYTVIYDPTGGDFLLGRFTDIRLPVKYKGWPENIAFQNRCSFQIVAYTGGKLRELGRCNKAGLLSVRLSQIAAVHPPSHPNFIKALADIREHYKTCTQCRTYLDWLANVCIQPAPDLEPELTND